MQTVSLLSHFYRLLTLKNKPQDLAYSVVMFGVLLCTLFVLTSKIAEAIAANALPEQLQAMSPILSWWFVLQEIIFLALLYFLLNFHNKANRFIQVASNFIGISLIECLISPLLSKFILYFYLLCAFKAWLLIIKFHITRHAFNINHMRAAWIFIGINLCTIMATAGIITVLSNTIRAY